MYSSIKMVLLVTADAGGTQAILNTAGNLTFQPDVENGQPAEQAKQKTGVNQRREQKRGQ